MPSTKRGLFLGCDRGGDLSTRRRGLQFSLNQELVRHINYYVTRKWNKLERHDDATTCKAGDTGVEDTQQTLGQQTETASGTSPPVSRNHHQFCPGEEDLSIVNRVFKGFIASARNLKSSVCVHLWSELRKGFVCIYECAEFVTLLSRTVPLCIYNEC